MKAFFKFLFATFIGALLALGVFCIVSVILLVAISSSSSKTDVSLPDSFVLTVDLSSPIGERTIDDPLRNMPSNIGPFTLPVKQNTLGIREAVEAINAAAEDPAVKLIYLKASGLDCSIANMEAIRRAIENYKLSGKPVIAYADYYYLGNYYIASAADRIYMNSHGDGLIEGLGGSVLFYKDLLDKLGIQVELIRHGKFKAAMEPYIQNHMSESNRLQNERMLLSIWNSLADDICKSRDLSKDKLDSLVNALAISDAQSMIQYNLADSAVSHIEMDRIIADLYGVEKETDVKTVTLGDYAKHNASRSSKVNSKDRIAIIYAEGKIGMGEDELTAQQICPVIKRVAADSSVKAVVFRINSPGGQVMEGEYIRAELQELRKNKPVVCSFGEYAASGGYYIAAQTDEIITERTTLTGSIGVFGCLFNYGDALRKNLFINAETVKTHKHTPIDIVMPEALDETQLNFLQNSIERVYADFVSIVSDGRKMSFDAVDSLGQGRVWTGSDAIECSLADKIGGIDFAIEEAARIAGLAEYKVVEYPKVKSSIETFMESLSNGGKATALLPEQFRDIEKAYSYLKDFKGREVYALMPYVYEITY